MLYTCRFWINLTHFGLHFYKTISVTHGVSFRHTVVLLKEGNGRLLAARDKSVKRNIAHKYPVSFTAYPDDRANLTCYCVG